MTTYFFDSYLPVRLAHMLAALDLPVQHLSAELQHEAIRFPADEEWLPRLQNRDVILITIDRFTKKGSAAGLALMSSGVTAIFLPKGFESLDKWAQATWLIKNWRAIEEFARYLQPGMWAQASLGGSIEPVEPK